MTAQFTEPVVQRVLLARLNIINGVYCWRNNSGGAQLPLGRGKYRTVVFGHEGQGDISGLIRIPGQRYSARLEIECKGPGEKQLPSQIEFQHLIEAVGGLYLLAVGEYQSTLDFVAKLAQGT